MPRHEFRPGKLVVGLALLGGGVVFLGDAAGFWRAPALVLVPIVGLGLLLAAGTNALDYAVRRRRPASTASSENTEAPASNSGSQAMR